MKKCLSLVLVFALCLSLCACGSTGDKETMIAQAKDYVTGNAYGVVIDSSDNQLVTTFFFAEDGSVMWVESIPNSDRDDVVCYVTEVSYRVLGDELYMDFETSNNSHKTIKVVFVDGQPDAVMLCCFGNSYPATEYTGAYTSDK